MKKRSHTINYRIAICFLISLIILFVMMIYYYFTIQYTKQEELHTYFERDSNYIRAELNRTINTMVDSAQTAGYTTAMQKTLFSDAPTEKITHINTARELITISKDKSDYIVDLFYVAENSHLYTNSEYIRYFRANMESYEFDKNMNIDHEFLSDSVINERNAYFFLYYLPIYRTAAGISYNSHNNGLCAILCNFSKILPKSKEIISNLYACYLIYDNRIISSNMPVEGMKEADLSKIHDGYGTLEYGGQSYYSYSMEDDHWKIVCLADKNIIGIKNFGLDKRFYSIVVFGSLMFIILLLDISKDFSKAVNRMITDLNSMKNSSDQHRISIPKVKELRTIAEQINNMIDRLEESDKKEQRVREQLYSATIAQQEAEMTAYRSQINPHFFFNTLECIRSMAQYYQANMIEEIIGAMSKMFRYSLYSKMVVPLAKEIDMLEQYFLITSLRFPDHYILEKEVSKKTLDVLVPSMIIQPLVENSIKHAFTKPTNDSINKVLIHTELHESGILEISITDNGCGMTADELEHLKVRNRICEEADNTSKDSIGIQNIYKRIKLFNQNNRMEFYSEYGKYTKVVLLLYPAEIQISKPSENS